MDSISLYNRTDCCGNRLSNVRVAVLDGSSNEVYGVDIPNSSPVGTARAFAMPYGGATGRYVRVMSLPGNNLDGNNILSFAEIEVWGDDLYPNVARNPLAVATQSSTLANVANPVAGKAIDGLADGIFSNGGVSHTTGYPFPPFWEADLGALYSINEITLLNRQDCCGERLSNFRLSLFNGVTEVYGLDVLTNVPTHGQFPVGLVEGDRIRVQLLGTNNGGGYLLSLAEVQAFGVLGTPVAPLIGVHPQGANVYEGGSVALGVAVSRGSMPFSYQWYQDTTLLPGETGPTLAIANATGADSGAYTVVVTNLGGAVTSLVATVNVQAPVTPTITQQPQSTTNYPGQTAAFGVVAGGSPNFTYQWRFAGLDIAGANAAALSVANVQSTNAGDYTVVVSNSVGSVTSEVAVLTVVAPVLDSYEAAVLAHRPLAFWRFDDAVNVPPPGGSATNSGSLGTPGNGVYLGTRTMQQAGALAGDADKCVFFDGSSGKLDLAQNAALNPSNTLTVEAWVMPVDGYNTTRSPISSRYIPSGQGYGFLMYATAANQWQFRTYNGTTAFNVTGGTVQMGAWTHLVGVYDGEATRLYVNGVAVGTPTTNLYAPNWVTPLRIGGGANEGTGSFFWPGLLDEVAIYSNALSPAQVLEHYDNGTNSARGTAYDQLVLSHAPVGYWRLNEATPAPGTYVARNRGRLGAAANGTYSYGVSTAAGMDAPSFVGFESGNTGIHVDGANGYVGTALSLLNNQTNFSVAGWLRRGAVRSTRGGYFGQNDLLEFGDAGSGTTIEAWMGSAGGSGNIVVPWPWQNGEWGQITYSYDGATARLFTNGILAGQRSAPLSSIPPTSFKFNIGGGGIFNGSGDYFLGDIDEVAVFDRAFDTNTVRSLYFSAVPVMPELVTDLPATNYVFDGGTMTLSVVALGTPPLRYQWWYFGTPIEGETNNTYTVSPYNDGYAGPYYCSVSNSAGGLYSTQCEVVTLYETEPPTISGPSPAYLARIPGHNASFSAVASGGLTLTYQWQHNGIDIPDATNSVVTINNILSGDAGDYRVIVANSCCSATSQVAVLDVLVPGTGSYAGKLLGLGPIAYWTVNEQVGPVAYDVISARDATASGGVIFATNGIQPPSFAGMPSTNNAVALDGTTGTLGTGSSFMNNLPAFSILCWVNPSVTLGGRIAFVGQNDAIEFGTHNANRVGIWTPGGGFAETTVPLPVNTWTFVACVADGTNYKIYFDAKLVATGGGATGNYGASSDPVNIGSAVLDSSGNFFPGLLDEIAVFNKALTAGELCDLYLTAWGGSLSLGVTHATNVVSDTKPSGLPFDGQNNGAFWVGTNVDATPYIRRGVMRFDQPSNSQVTVPPNAAISSTAGAITFWMRSSGNIGAGNEGAMLIDRRPGSGDVIVLFDNGTIFVQPEWMYSQAGTRAVNDDKWHHVAYVYDQSASGYVTVYIDGTQEFSVANPRAWSWGSQQIELGRSHDGYWKVYHGLLDDVRIYNAVLSPAEVAAIHAGEGGGLVAPGNLVLLLNFDMPPLPIPYWLNWPCGTLLYSEQLPATWAPLPNATAPYPFRLQTPREVPQRFYNIQAP